MTDATKPRSVVITGASTGIGAACARRLDAEGFRVFAGVRKEADGEALRAKTSERLTPILVDVTEETQIDRAAAQVAETVGEDGLQGLVNNAGIAVAGPLEFVPVSELRRQLEVNVLGVVAVTQAFLPMLRQGRGRVVNMGSVSGRLAMPFLGPYAASKFALEALSDALRPELRAWGIKVALIEPGVIATPLWQKSKDAGETLSEQMPEECHRLYGAALDKLRATVNRMEKIGVPADKVADVVLHALTARRPKTRYLVGGGARLQTHLGGLLPDRMRDWLVLRAMGIK